MITRLVLVLLSLLLASPALAQREYAPRRMDVVQRVASSCPGLILQDHAFTDAVATLLNLEDDRWGRNGKRGNAGDPSHDAIAYRTSASPFGVAVIDIIGAAGSRDASPAWIDQTDATIAAGTTGVWVRPSGALPACLSGTPTEPVEPTVPIVPTFPVDYRPVLNDISQRLAIIDARLTAIEQRDPASPDLGLLNMYIDAMIGNGPDGGTGPHVTDIKQRLDVIRVQLDQLNGWLRGRAVLRY